MKISAIRGCLGSAIIVSMLQLAWSSAHAQAASPPPGRTRVVMLGTGTPGANPDRFGPAVVVLVDSSAYLFDIGVGVVRQWAAALRNGIAPLGVSDLRTAFVTHLHSDHTVGYPELILSSWTLDPAVRPLDVYGPRGLRRMTEHILAAYAEDIATRTGKGGEKEGKARPEVRVHEIDPGTVYNDSLVSITAFRVPHGTWDQSFGYRISTPDRTIVISGDAAPSPAIAEQCRGCDILIHEGGTMLEASAGEYFRTFHTTAEALASIATAAAPRLLVLYHQPRTGPAVDRAYRVLRSLYPGAFVVARDLDVFY
ncbi:MAG TPA: MBL fold metallo-hydrolase [Gemmatimonadales bacterium]|nr:MBL fold metallo-hydrolase [Gemmatimonadales bacterium]